jgi:hypothetical protein
MAFVPKGTIYPYTLSGFRTLELREGERVRITTYPIIRAVRTFFFGCPDTDRL